LYESVRNVEDGSGLGGAPWTGPGFGGFDGNPVALKSDSMMSGFWDPSRQRYYAYLRVQPPPSCLRDHPTTCMFHRIGVTSSADFLSWTPPQEILVGDSEQTNLTYAMVGWKEADTYLGLVMVYRLRGVLISSQPELRILD
jgi:hypothetical protein